MKDLLGMTDTEQIIELAKRLAESDQARQAAEARMAELETSERASERLHRTWHDRALKAEERAEQAEAKLADYDLRFQTLDKAMDIALNGDLKGAAAFIATKRKEMGW